MTAREDLRDAVNLAAVEAFGHVAPARMLADIPPIRRAMAAVWLGGDCTDLQELVDELHRDARTDDAREAWAAFADTVRQLAAPVQP